jgi:hypothetical protein
MNRIPTGHTILWSSEFKNRSSERKAEPVIGKFRELNPAME